MAQRAKKLSAMRETQVGFLGWEDPLEKGMATHPLFWLGKSQGQRSLASYSPWGSRESDATEQVTLFQLSCSNYIVHGSK